MMISHDIIFALYSLCRGYTLHKLLHYWSEIFSLERLVNVGRQIAQVSYKLVEIFYLVTRQWVIYMLVA